jgi:hypothetical protein
MQEDHIIHQMRVELRSANRQMALDLQRQLSYELHKADFRQRLDAMLTDLLPGDEYLEIPSLSIHLELNEDTGMDLQLLHALKEAIEDKIRNRVGTDTAFMPRNIYEESVQLFFLRYGILRFRHSGNVVARMISQIRELPSKPVPELEALLLKAATGHPAVWKRIYYQLGPEAMKVFFLRISGLSLLRFDQFVLSTIQKNGERMTATPDVYLWQQIFLTYTINREQWAESRHPRRITLTEPGAEYMTSQERNGSAVSEKKAVVNTPLIPVEELSGGLEIRYAGIVLLWLEFGQLLHDLQLVKERAFADESAKQQAVLILHYIAAGHTAASEEDLLLNKMLCNWPLNEPVEIIELSEPVKAAAAKMLEEYMAGWRKDRKFSAGWFRAAYLQREGQLLRRNDGQWELTVTHKTEDILINKVSIIRYSWMHHLLFIRW